MKKLRITVLFDRPEPPPPDQDYGEALKTYEEPEFEVAAGLKDLGHQVSLRQFLRQAIGEAWRRNLPGALIHDRDDLDRDRTRSLHDGRLQASNQQDQEWRPASQNQTSASAAARWCQCWPCGKTWAPLTFPA